MNIFSQIGRKLLDRGITALPARFASKAALLEGYTQYFDRKPTEDEVKQWETLQYANVDILLGQCSGIVALDIDETRPEVLEVILPLLPDSPVVKKGAKGETRFFRYTGNPSESFKYQGEMVIEILSDNKKTTVGRHESGVDYKWTKSNLWDIDINDLDVLPPFLISELELTVKSKLGGETESYGKVSSGRNTDLSSYVGTLLQNDAHSMDDVISKLLKYDYENNSPPYFTDLEEHRTASAVTNAINFYTTHLNSFNQKRHRKNEAYVEPTLIESNNMATLEVVEEGAPKKEEPQAKSLKAHEHILANTAVKTIFETINANSWVKQPELALGAILALGATLCSRKFMFQGITTNMYICNIAPSGAGKNAGMEFAKNTLLDLKADRYLGAGDMASDAGIMDSLADNKPIQLYAMDEIGGILKTITSGGAEYNSKMADILAELYTVSTGRYLGRALSTGVKGAIDRPHLNILGATTPTGFRQGVSRAALEKGLMGRFLLFFGDPDVPATRVKQITKMPAHVMNNLHWLANYEPEDNENVIVGGRNQLVTELTISADADRRLDEIFYVLDKVRLENLNDTISPVAARLYQQMIKLVIIHACLNSNRQVPVIQVDDVEFAYNVITTLFEKFKLEIEDLIFDSPLERAKGRIKKLIRDAGYISRTDIMKLTKDMNKNYRDSILSELIDTNEIALTRLETEGGKMMYKVVK